MVISIKSAAFSLPVLIASAAPLFKSLFALMPPKMLAIPDIAIHGIAILLAHCHLSEDGQDVHSDRKILCDLDFAVVTMPKVVVKRLACQQRLG